MNTLYFFLGIIEEYVDYPFFSKFEITTVIQILCKKWRIKIYFNTNVLFALNRLY